MMKLRQAVALLLLFAVPSPSFAQITIDHTQLDRVRVRLSETPSLDVAVPPLAHLSMQVDACASARIDGHRDASQGHKSNAWWTATVLGFFVPLFGIGIATGAAAMTKPEPTSLPPNVNSDCYREGYGKEGKRKNIRTALVASTLGTALVIVLLAAGAGPQYWSDDFEVPRASVR